MSTSLFIVLSVAVAFSIFALITGLGYLLEWLAEHKLKSIRYAAEVIFLDPEAKDLTWHELPSYGPVEPYYENDVLILDCPLYMGKQRRYVRCLADMRHKTWVPVNTRENFYPLWCATRRYARCRVWPNLK